MQLKSVAILSRRWTMGEEREERKAAGPEPGLGSGYREFSGRHEFPSNMVHGILAIGMWIGALHFNALLLLLSLLCLPFSKFLLYVLFLFPWKLLFLKYYFNFVIGKKEFKCTNSFLSFFPGCLDCFWFSFFFLSILTVNLGEGCPGTSSTARYY